jgi:catecholate siderophore receptor
MSRRSTFPSALPHSLGALAAGFGLMGLAQAQSAEPAAAASAVVPVAADSSAPPEASLRKITVKARKEVEQGKQSLQATTTTIGKGKQELRDVPQSITVVTERLMDDRNLDDFKDVLHNVAGITFQTGETGEEDIKLRGFSLSQAGDIYVDGMRDSTVYSRDTFNNDRVDVLRGSASMVFGRGSTGGVVNQVNKQPLLINQHEVTGTVGTGDYLRVTGDFNIKTGDDSALRINAMSTNATNYGAKINKTGVAPSYSWGIGTADEFNASLYYLDYDNVPYYGLPWLNNSTNGIDANNYYGMASDYWRGGATYGTLSHTHRFQDGGELKTTFRDGHYTRDILASAIGFASTTTSVTDATVLRRTAKVRTGDSHMQYLQSDYSNKFNAWGMKHVVLGGLDVAQEEANTYRWSSALTYPTTTVGTPNDGASVTSTRTRSLASTFKATGVGVYAQDLFSVTDTLKVLAGLRYDRFKGDYLTTPNGTTAGADYDRTDGLWSKRFGLIYQPDALSSYHFSYGTSFNTSGDTYQYDSRSENTDPEKSRNFELGSKLDLLDGRLSLSSALFWSEKYNERDTDPDSAATAYLLSGKRHAAGLELDVAGQLSKEWDLFVSYSFIPEAKIDQSTATTGEKQGDRPALTPRHSGSLWSTYKLTDKWRVGGGFTARGEQKPNRNPAATAPGFITYDAMAEYDLKDVAFKLNVKNLTNKHYADALYTSFYVPGAARSVQLQATLRF